MTEENQKRMYKYFVESGQEERAKEVLRIYPSFKTIPLETTEETKSKKGK